ncbi:MAG: ATP-binding cassette domain-containing protein [Tissierellia bacterium]|nr:ATP-binding cassette domain-containing protein [Tissierellia bacterium]
MEIVNKYADRLLLLEKGKLIEATDSRCKDISICKNDKKFSKKEALINITNLEKSYDHNRVLNKVSFNVYKGECLGILGKSGCGKSTLARILSCIEDYDEGSIKVGTLELRDLKKHKKRMLYKDIQLVFQNERGCLNPRDKISNLIKEPIRNLKIKDYDTDKAVEYYLNLVGLNAEIKDKRSVQLSTGQCQRVSLARALIVRPKLLILDEMVSALDTNLKWKIVRLLKEIIDEENLTCIVISHELDIINALCDRAIFIENGKKLVEFICSGEDIERIKRLFTNEEKNDKRE